MKTDWRQFWNFLVPDEIRPSFFISDSSLHTWIFNNLKQSRLMIEGVSWSVVFGYGCWNLWKRRNAAVFDNPNMSLLMLSRETIKQAKNCIKAFEKLKTNEDDSSRPMRNIYWNCPPEHCWKLNTDASCSTGTGLSFGGGLIRNSQGALKVGFVCNIGACSILKAELWALLHGIQLAIDKGFLNLQVECDNFVAVGMILGYHAINASCLSIVQNIRRLMSNFSSISADYLSHLAYDYEPGFHPLYSPLSNLYNWLVHDVVGVSYLR